MQFWWQIRVEKMTDETTLCWIPPVLILDSVLWGETAYVGGKFDKFVNW